MSFMLLLLACGRGDEVLQAPLDRSGEVSLPFPERGVQLSIGPFELPPFTETSRCRLVQLETAGSQAINALEHVYSPTGHHFNVYLLEGDISGPAEGDCTELWAKVEMGLTSPIYGSQTPAFRGDFPEGVAAKLPSGQWVMLEYHALNPYDRRVSTQAVFNAYAMPKGDVQAYANGLLGSISDLSLPPGQATTVSKRCYLKVDMQIFALASHAHRLLSSFEIWRLGPDDQPAELVYLSEDWHAPKVQVMSDAPLVMKRGEGFEYRCNYMNTTDETVVWGEGVGDEMCMMVGVYYPDADFQFCRSTPLPEEEEPVDTAAPDSAPPDSGAKDSTEP